MKKRLFPVCFLLAFCFSGFGQVDSAAVAREVDSLMQVSRALVDKRNFDKALEVNEVAERFVLEKLGKESAAYGKVCSNFGGVYNAKGDYALAEKWHLEALDVRQKALGKEHPDYAHSLNNLGILISR
ncbi:MAG: tetratricopeptide repeat protein, partial [Thermoanaerobaculia bacterium]|nr:tetratricopeptide repeat protein [Thermoanaerobaculia bacterium]